MKTQTIHSKTPINGQRILLRGFSADLEVEAKAKLTRHGYQLATSIALADILLTGGSNASAAIEAAQKAGITILEWADFSLRLPAPATADAPDPSADPASKPAVDVQEDFVRILDRALPRAKSNSRLVPAADEFRHLCHDATLLRNARAVALGARNGLPVALEGDTSASKTTSILWVAHLLGQPVVRLNLNGQTDTGELIGRYVPGGAGLAGSVRHTMSGGLPCGAGRDAGSLEPIRSWCKYRAAAVEEPAASPAWVFKEGCIPQAMRHGWWVILDEINLAEPQVLERLNSALDQPPSLVLSEADGTKFGSGGAVEVSPHFRLFATMNPAEYAGRSILSPAFRDRWLVWHQAESPGESAFAAMLRCLVFGEQPEISFQGARYQSLADEPAHPDLAHVPGIRELLPRLALFHASLCQASGMGGDAPSLGRLRRERYVFTRRSLLTCMKLLESAVAENPGTPLVRHLREAIEIAYIGRMRDGADRSAAIALLRAAGLSEEPS